MQLTESSLLLLLATALVLGTALAAWASGARWRDALADAARGEEGMSYAMPFVFVVPVFLVLVLGAYQVGMILFAKIGTMYAAHMGARSAVVWLPAGDPNMAQQRINQAVFTAMAPFTFGSSSDKGNTADPAADDYATAFLAYSAPSEGKGPPLAAPGLPTQFVQEDLRQHYLSAASRTVVQATPPLPTPEDQVTVTVTYRVPLILPVVSRIFADKATGPAEYTLTSSATLPSEAPKSVSGTLGIQYQPR
jgi:hypothetical protein